MAGKSPASTTYSVTWLTKISKCKFQISQCKLPDPRLPVALWHFNLQFSLCNLQSPPSIKSLGCAPEACATACDWFRSIATHLLPKPARLLAERQALQSITEPLLHLVNCLF